ncbi:MAG TPA: carboxypeptidase-like regulatory domain-containing protein [Thermoanaerobaculia bacterium]|nr:carboxypeptidase-like regulatory domain-containing protein [Thermoanaerobaculia bacterium]
MQLGTLPLRSGASLSGWTRRDSDQLPLRDVRVAVYPTTASGEPAAPLHTWKAASDEHGFFQVHGLQPGSYRVEVSAADHVPQVFEAVELAAGAETLLGTVLLTAPLRLTLQLVPPRHPNGQPWMVRASPVLRLAAEDHVEVRADDHGLAELGGLRPAEYSLQVTGPEGESFGSQTRRITADAFLVLEVPVVEVKGTVRLGDEPLAATVRLEGGKTDRAEITSDEDGRLGGWIRRPDRPWLMATVLWQEAGEPRRRLVEVVPGLEGDVLELDIDLPAGVIFGEVVDPQGEPQPGAQVRATPAAGASRFTEVRGETDASGRFHLTGLDATRYLVQAGSAGRPGSEAVRIDLASDLPVGDVRLVVWPNRTVTIQVTRRGQSVAGAVVSLAGFGRVPVTIEGTTDGRGQVELEVPEDLAQSVATVFAPSQLLWSGCVSLAADAVPLTLPNHTPGALLLSLGGRMDLPPDLGGQQVLLTGEGGFVGYSALVQWNRRRGAERHFEQEGDRGLERLHLPAMAPGRYALTWSAAPDWELAARSCAGALPEARWAELPAGGEAELQADSSAAQARRLRELAESAER